MSLGMGVMINMLGGNAETVDAFNGSKNKTIKQAELDKADNVLRLHFTDGTGIKFFDDGQSCCETRYMNCDDDLEYFSGATLMSAEISDGPDVEAEYEKHEQQFLKIITSKGVFTVANHNEHNGYYGGFSIVVRELK